MKTKLVFDDKTRVGNWVADQVEQTASWGDFYAMGIERDGQIIAGIVFNNFNDSNATAHIAIEKFSKLTTELLRHSTLYAFEYCKLKRLTGMVDADNTKALTLDRKLGFEPEFIMEQAGSEGQDLHVLVLWPENFRYR